MNRLTALAAVAMLALAGCSTPSGSAPLPQAPPTSAAEQAPVTTEAPPVTEAPVAAPAGSTCDKAREAILTGTPAGITKAMKALVADKAAPATAREYARYYTVRDKDSKDLREMDVSLIQMSCS